MNEGESASDLDMTAVVLVGGRGTRIQAVHPDVPKPMIPVLGRPFLHWLTAVLAFNGITRFVYSTGYRGDQIESWARDASFSSLIRLVRHESAPLGTGGGLLNCLDLCGEWTLVVNGDGLCLAGMAELLAIREMPGVMGGLIGVRVDDSARYGSLDVGADGRLIAFREKVPGRGIVNGGVYLFRTAALAALELSGPQSLEHDVIPALLSKGARLQVVGVDTAPFIDIGTPETLRDAEAFLSRHLAHLVDADVIDTKIYRARPPKASH